MHKQFLAVLVVLMSLFSVPAMGQEPATKPVPVVLRPEGYTELEALNKQLADAKQEETAAVANANFRQAMRIAIEQAIESARLRALMAVGVTDPKAEIAAPPKPAAP